jgi:hypothetical protein
MPVNTLARFRRPAAAAGVLFLLSAAALIGVTCPARDAQAGFFSRHGRHAKDDSGCAEGPPIDDLGGTWYWLHSPDEEKRIVMGLFNRYCIRCHSQEGRGVWDIPGIPDFTNARWQAMRSDGQIARIIIEGRGAVMPPFRGTLSIEEAYGIARYLRTFVPGTEMPRPDRSAAVSPKTP